MYRLIKFLFTGDWHLHEWTILRESPITYTGCAAKGLNYHLQCKHCGAMKFTASV